MPLEPSSRQAEPRLLAQGPRMLELLRRQAVRRLEVLRPEQRRRWVKERWRLMSPEQRQERR
jgi:hypothetical protein